MFKYLSQPNPALRLLFQKKVTWIFFSYCSFAATFSEAFGKCSEPDSLIAILEALFPCIVQICMKKNSCFFCMMIAKKLILCVCVENGSSTHV